MNKQTPNSADASFKRLAAKLPVWFCADACLKLRPIGVGCEGCRDACPVNAICMEAGCVELVATCTGCGRCAAECPSGALRVEGFDEFLQPLSDDGATGPLHLECHRVPSKTARNGSQVPCLGGISFAALIERVVQTLGAVTLIDRGWCATCPSGAGRTPMDEQVDKVRMVIADIGLSDERFPRVISMPTPHDLALSATAMTDETPALRRAFFGALLKRTAQAAAAMRAPDISRLTVETTRSALSASPVIYLTRKRMAANLLELARQAGKPLSAKFFPDMSVSGRCALHGVCSEICPSGALIVIRGDTSAGLCFDPELCLDCGLCIRHCPTDSLIELPRGNSTELYSTNRKQLNYYPMRDCIRCGKGFVNHGFDDTCPTCQSGRKMA